MAVLYRMLEWPWLLGLPFCGGLVDFPLWIKMDGRQWYKPLARQFGFTAVKLQMFGSKTRHFWHPMRTCFLSRVHAWMQLTINLINELQIPAAAVVSSHWKSLIFHGPLHKLWGEWEQAFGGRISGIVCGNKRWLRLMDGISKGTHQTIPEFFAQKTWHL